MLGNHRMGGGGTSRNALKVHLALGAESALALTHAVMSHTGTCV